jgi:hybrid cluster-associated redox disulfide protein
MNTIFNQTTTVEAVFKTLPGTSHVFIKYKLGCVGCYLARFCTLEEVAKVYELDLELFLNKLERYTYLPPKSEE